MAGMDDLTKSEIVLMLNAFTGECGPRNRLLFLFGITTGFRISEILSVKIGDIYKNGHILPEVKVAKGYMKGKAASREVGLNPQLQRELLAYLTLMNCFEPNHYLFCSEFSRNRPMNRKTANFSIKQAQDRAGLQDKHLGTHCMRKTACQHIYKQSGNNIRAVQDFAGHAYVTSTQNYINPERKETAKIMNDWEFDYDNQAKVG